MKNREKFKEVFGVEVRWTNALTPQIEALSSITLKRVSCAGEWLESEYKEQPTINVISISNGATIGDVMKTIFPDEEVIETDSGCVYFGAKMRFDKDLWNAPYKKEVEK